MEMFGNIRCVTYGELVGSGILSESNYKKKVRDGKLRVVRPGKGKGSCALIDYNSIPEPVREEYNAKFPHAVEQIKEQYMSNILIPDPKAVEYYRDKYRLPDGSGLTDKKQAEYVLNAEVMNEMIRVESNTRALHSKCGFIRKAQVWEAVEGTCDKLREAYGHTLRNSRLREKFNQYKKEGYAALVSRKVGNQNTRKIGTEEARLLLKLRRSRVPVYTEMQIFEEFNHQATLRGLEQLKSPTSVRNFLFSPAIQPLWFAIVHGELEWRKKYSALLKTEQPSLRDSVWYSDGTKLNLYYRNESGKICTTSVYEVMDAYSEVLLGYDIAPGEKFDSQFRAFRMAVETAKVKPYEIVNDNQGGHKKLSAQDFFKKICRLHRFTAPYSGQSKTIESVFGRFQTQILHKYWNFTGQNITATKQNSHPNMELILSNVDKLPTLKEMKQLYAECRNEWNESAHPATGISRQDMYTMSENPLTVPVTELDMIQMFWLKSKKPITYTNSGLCIEIGKRKYEYEVYGANGLRDESFAMKHTGQKFHVLYDPRDMTLVELWYETADGLKFASGATPKVSVHRAIQDQEHEETVQMRAQIEASKANRAAMLLLMENFDKEEGIALEYFGLNTPKTKGLSDKKMRGYREEYEDGTLIPPVQLPPKSEQPEESDQVLEFSDVGEYTKELSNFTFDDVDRYNRY